MLQSVAFTNTIFAKEKRFKYTNGEDGDDNDNESEDDKNSDDDCSAMLTIK